MGLRILFFCDNFPPETNAAASRVFERAVYWVRWGHQVTVITSVPNFPQGRVYDGYENRWHQVEKMAGIRVVRVKTFIAPNRGVVRRGLDFASYMVTAFAASAWEARPDIVVSTSPQFLAAVAGCGSSILKGTPYVFELGDLWPASIAEVGAMRSGLALRTLECIELALYRRSTAIVALTHSFKDNLVVRGIPEEKIAVVINGVDLGRWRQGQENSQLASELGLDGKFVVSYIGTQGMAHGLQNVLAAADNLRERTDIVFLFVGAGAAHTALVDEARQRRLRNVLFVSPQPKPLIGNYWYLSDIALVHLRAIPVMRTVIPSKTFEAMGFGLPILLVAPPGEISRIVEDTGSGLVVEPGNPGALAQAVRRLADNPDVRQSLAARSKMAAPRFSREKQAHDMLSVLTAVTEGKPLPNFVR